MELSNTQTRFLHPMLIAFMMYAKCKRTSACTMLSSIALAGGIVWMNQCLHGFCPGFMCVPRKPHPFGNEYHSICDSDLNGAGGGNPIMWHAEIQEGMDRPAELGAKKYDEKGKTVGLMCWMVEPIKSTGKCVTMIVVLQFQWE